MTDSVYIFGEVEARKPTPQTTSLTIKDIFRANDGACYREVESFLMPPGKSGSRSFDQAYAVSVLLKHDADLGGRLAAMMESTGLSRRMLWDRMQNVLRQVGFKMRHGRLVGLLEGPKPEEKNGDIGQPDID